MSKALPYFRVWIKDPNNRWKPQRITALLDTGASVSVISPNLNILSDKDCVIMRTNTTLVGFNGKSSKASGKTKCMLIDKKGKELLIQPIISPTELGNCLLILGWDVIQKFHVQIIENNLNLFAQKSAPMVTWDHSQRPGSGSYRYLNTMEVRDKRAMDFRKENKFAIDFRKKDELAMDFRKENELAMDYRKDKKREIDQRVQKVNCSKKKVFEFKEKKLMGLPMLEFEMINTMKVYSMNAVTLNPGETVEIPVIRLGTSVKGANVTSPNERFVEGDRSCPELEIISKIIDTNDSQITLEAKNHSLNHVVIRENTCLGNEWSEYELSLPQEMINMVKLRDIPRESRKFEELDMSSICLGGQLKKSEQESLKKLIKKYHFIFSRGEYDLGKYNGKQRYEIELTTNEHQPRKFIKIPPGKEKLVQEHIEKLLECDVIEEADTDKITTSFIIVKKPDGSFRLANDSRSVNNVTKPTANFVIPKISEVLAQLSQNKYYTSLDMNSSYHQIPLADHQKNLYTFLGTDNKTVYRYTCSPFGSKMISNVFQSILAGTVLKGIKGSVSYIDDVILFSNTFAEHLKTIELVFERFAKYNLSLKIKKCKFAEKSVDAFGYKVDIDGFTPMTSRTDKLKKLPCPETRKEMKSSLQALSYYRCHIPQFSHLTREMYQLTSEKQKFELTTEIRSKWTELLKNMSSCILMTRPHFNGSFVLMTDASKDAISCTLFEKQNGKIRIILADSKILNTAQRNYSISQLELMAIAVFLRKWENFLIFEKSFDIHCDNLSVVYTLRHIDKYTISGFNPTSRHLIYISTFNYKVYHKKGSSPEFLIVDLLSRRMITEKSTMIIETKPKKALVTVTDVMGKQIDFDSIKGNLHKESYYDNFRKIPIVRCREEKARTNTPDVHARKVQFSQSTEPSLAWSEDNTTNQTSYDSSEPDESGEPDQRIKEMKINSVNIRLPTHIRGTELHMEIKLEQKKSMSIKQQLRKLRSNKQNGFFSINEKIEGSKYQILYRNPGKLLVVPKEYISTLLNKLHKHESSKILNNLTRNLGLYVSWQSIQHFVQECNTCMTAKSGKPVKTGNFTTIPSSNAVFQSIHSDIAHLPNNFYVLTGVCQFSKYTIFTVMKDQTAETLSRNLCQQLLDFNLPLEVHSDNGTNYTSNEVSALLESMNIVHRKITPFNSPANGLAEKANNLLQNELRLMSDQIQKNNFEDVVFFVKLAAYIINSRPNKETGYSPIEMVFLQKPAWPARTPDLSKTKVQSLKTYLKSAYLRAKQIEAEMKQRKLDKVKHLEDQENISINLKRGDIVKIKQKQKVGEGKKYFKPWSADYYRIVQLLFFSKTALLERVEASPHMRKQRLKLSVNRLKKCRLPPEMKDEKMSSETRDKEMPVDEKLLPEAGESKPTEENNAEKVGLEDETEADNEAEEVSHRPRRLRQTKRVNYKV